MQHAHGQSDFQRIFANCKKGSLWFFTAGEGHNGEQNFKVFCDEVLCHCADRYNEVILARRLEPDEKAPDDKNDAYAKGIIIAHWEPGRENMQKVKGANGAMNAAKEIFGVQDAAVTRLQERIGRDVEYLRAKYGNLSDEQIEHIRQRNQVEHHQELACMGYLNGEVYTNQGRLYASQEGHATNPDDRRYVIADVQQTLSQRQAKELRLDAGNELQSLPWEVKDCDGMNPMQHAHGQSDFQRIFANCKKGSLWFFTAGEGHNGEQNFKVFCDEVLCHCADRYNEVILARRLEPDEKAPDDKNDAYAKGIIIAHWESGRVEWTTTSTRTSSPREASLGSESGMPAMVNPDESKDVDMSMTPARSGTVQEQQSVEKANGVAIGIAEGVTATPSTESENGNGRKRRRNPCDNECIEFKMLLHQLGSIPSSAAELESTLRRYETWSSLEVTLESLGWALTNKLLRSD